MSGNGRHVTTTYRGATLDEVLPRIREELGPEAVILRQREGIVGGFGGFFGKRCVEIEARAAATRQSEPSHRVLGAYDATEQAPEEEHNPLLQTLLDQSSPFAVELSGALHVEPAASEAPPAREEPVAVAAPAPEAPPAPPVQAAPVQQMPAWVEALEEDWSSEETTEQPAVRFADDGDLVDEFGNWAGGALVDEVEEWADEDDVLDQDAVDARRVRTRGVEPFGDDAATARAVRDELLDIGFSSDVADELLAEARRTLRPFAPSVPLDVLVRRALIRRIKVDAGWDRKRRTITLIGTSGTGRTLTAAKLCNAYAGAGRTVKALSLEPARDAMKLAALTQHGNIGLEIATTPGDLRRARLSDADIVVIDTPPIDVFNPVAFAPTARLLSEVRTSETHLLLRSDANYEAGKALITVLSGPVKPSRIVVTGADRDAPASGPVSLSLEFGIPISFVADGPNASSGVHPAEADELGDLAFP